MSKNNILSLVICFLILGTISSYSGIRNINETDSDENFSMFAFFDLRDRESFIQVTNTSSAPANYHIQIFNVANLCNENNFFDDYTGNDTHVYNMRDILTNDTNPSGVDLPDNAYGIVAVSILNSEGQLTNEGTMIGNFRIVDSSGYEYRTNLAATASFPGVEDSNSIYYTNFNQQGGVSLSDVVGLYLVIVQGSNGEFNEWDASNVINTFVVMDVDIIDNNEVLLSCRDIIFACVQPNDPLVDELLAQNSGNSNFQGENGASVASLEYGINNTIPHSKGGELLCPGNVIGEGFVKMTLQGFIVPESFDGDNFAGFIGLNNGNGRGSMDSFWEEPVPPTS